MQNNRTALIILAVVVVAILGYLVGTQQNKDTGFNISKGDSVGEIIEEVGDEIDDATTR